MITDPSKKPYICPLLSCDYLNLFLLQVSINGMDSYYFSDLIAYNSLPLAQSILAMLVSLLYFQSTSTLLSLDL